MAKEHYDNKVAVITGAGSGIGRALAIDLARDGANLALSDVNEQTLAETVSMCRGAGKRTVKSYILDVTDRGAMFAHAEDVERDFGAAHYLFNNAGATLVATFAHATIEELEWQINLNLWGVIYGTKAFLPAMLARGEGCIVNLSSAFGFVGYPMQSGYSMTKFAVRGLTETLWQELRGTGVRAICVHPGGIRTNISNLGRYGQNAGAMEATFSSKAEAKLVTSPEDCARAILHGVRSGKRRIVTGAHSQTLFWLSRLLPNHYPNILRLLL